MFIVKVMTFVMFNVANSGGLHVPVLIWGGNAHTHTLRKRIEICMHTEKKRDLITTKCIWPQYKMYNIYGSMAIPLRSMLPVAGRGHQTDPLCGEVQPFVTEPFISGFSMKICRSTL